MSIPVLLTVCVAILVSTVIIIVVTATGLQRTPFCLIPSLGIIVVIWMAYPPAQQLPPLVSIVGWALLTVVLYHFPVPQPSAPMGRSPSNTDDDLLEQFFKETYR